MKKLLLVLAFTLGMVVNNVAQTSFNADTDHSISLSNAQTMTHQFRVSYPSLNIGNAFGKTALLSVLDQEGCAGIRFYNAVDAYGVLKLVGVGVLANNSEITGGVIIERSICCTVSRCFPCGTTFD